MTIANSAIPTPIGKPNQVVPIVDVNTGCLTDHGIQLWSQLYNFVVGMNRIVPCNASGTNVITLTPLDASPLLKQYADYEVFSFVAANTSTGSVTMNVAARDGSLATLKVYKTNGSNQASTGDVVANFHYTATYVDSFDSGAGGFVLR